ncbi:hypothetical protein V8C86DRAFT_2475799 [Haematococcus lacustris]|nr:hypothetical protein QJQ45_001086 [Haematococcus lacustris]
MQLQRLAGNRGPVAWHRQRVACVHQCQTRSLHRSRARTVPSVASAEAEPSGKPDQEDVEDDDLGVSLYAGSVMQYAMDLAEASRTYTVHSWMLLLGILKYEDCTAAKVLKSMGLDDLRGAWHEVLWALHACDGLQPRPWEPEITFAERAHKVLTGATNFAQFNGRAKVQSEDVLMALACAYVLEGLFPDIAPTFPRVREAVEKFTGGRYSLPDEDADEDSNEAEPVF